MPFVLAHVSDLHVSTFGDTFHDRARIVKRSAHIADSSALRWNELWSEAGWRVLRAREGRKLQILDPEGYSHPAPRRKELPHLLDPVERAAAKACQLEARRAHTLAGHAPTEGALAILAEATPKNSNVRLVRAARRVAGGGVDAVAITGDLTDDGDGYELVGAVFETFRAKQRLYAVPGNHDRYLFPMSGSARPKPTTESKARAWRGFAETLSLRLEPCGAWYEELPEAGVALLGLDSCARAQRRFYRHNGVIGPEQLAFLRDLSQTEGWRRARHRIVLLHHHVVPLPHGVGRRAPSEIGMRLDDAREAAEAFNAADVTLVMHGHRHVSEERQPAGCNFTLLAAPSLTLGCRSGDGPSYWRVELGEHAHATRVHIPFEAIDGDDTDEPPSPVA